MTRTVGQTVAEASEAVPTVKVQDLAQWMQENPDALLIDVRDSAQANAESIPGAINIDYGTCCLRQTMRYRKSGAIHVYRTVPA